MTARRPSTAEWLRGLVGARTGLALGLLLGALVAPPWALSTSAPTPEDRCGAIGMDAPYEIVQLASASDI